MKKEEPNVVSGAVICGIIGISAIGLYLVFRKKDTALDEISKMICNVGEILHKNQVCEPSLVKDFGKKLHNNEQSVGAIVDWVAAGISLWKKFKH